MAIGINSILSERYQILEFIGQGGMASVYRAYDMTLQRDVAVKTLHKEFTGNPAFRQRFQQEARSAANLSHPNIVTVFDFGKHEEHYFIIMEWIKGTDLKTFLLQTSCLSDVQIVDLMTQICFGVGFAHRAGLVHCDLKPQNILLTADFRIKITDFGISRALGSIHPEERTETVWGSPQYLAPELVTGGPPSPASDVYALGVIAYEMFTGKLPFTHPDTKKLMEMHLHNPVPPPSKQNPAIATSIEQIILKVLSKEPAARYRTADQFGRVLLAFGKSEGLDTNDSNGPLSQFLETVDLPAVPVSLPDGNVDWLAVSLGLLAFLAVGGLIPLWLWTCLLYPQCPILIQ